MPEMNYLNFDLLIQRSEAGYRAHVFDSPAGQAAGDFVIPFSDLELENFLLRVGRPRRGAVRDARRPEWSARKVAETFGGRLFEAVFDDDLRACLDSSLDEAVRQGSGLRIRLRLTDAPELADLPWEFLFNPALRRFFVLSRETPLVRYLELPEPTRPLVVRPPLKVLVMISSPRDYAPLGAEREWANLIEALGDLEQRGLVALERLEKATLPALHRQILNGQYHVFHYIGHGDFDERVQDGLLLLEDERGRGHPVSGQHLGTLLRDHRPLRLAILNACEGARTSRTDPFAGTAQSLVQQGGVPAVIAMQFEVTDEAAITFAQWFYAAVADGHPVDAALAEARKAINNRGYGVEWGTPVLYMRAPDGRIFDIGPVRKEEPPPAPMPPPRPPDVSTNNLPVPLTRFIGREGERAAVKQWLSTTRLLTLTGPGGCGKTRLALEVARDLVAAYADGVWWVGLAGVADPALVAQAVAKVLDVREEPGRRLEETLTDHLRPREMVLVLDNCEHLVEGCAILADTLLRTCPKLRLVATSREALDVAGEVVWVVPPLSLPDGRPGLPSVEELAKYEAVSLFTDRAQLRRRGFALTERNALGVVQICRRLDGLPLAIEMAAAWVRVLSVEQIAMRLDDRFRLLTWDRPAGLPHHQTLRAAVDWSYELLSEAERTLFDRLSVFAGGFTLEAAEAVGAGGSVEVHDVVDLLARLVDKSLVMVEEGSDGSMRYRMLETLRQYGQERLAESGELEETQRRHAGYFLTLVEEAEPELTGPEQATWLERLEAEHDNLRAALRWARESGEAETGLRLAGSLWWFWSVRGYYAEGRKRLEALLVLPGALQPTAVRAKALNAAGVLADYQGDHDAARSFYGESLAICRDLDDKPGTAASLYNLGLVAYQQGDYDTARSQYEQCLQIRRELGDRWGVAVSLSGLGNVARDQGDYSTARRLHEESLATRRELGDQRGIAVSLYNVGQVAYEQGDYDAARALYEECLAITQKLGDSQGIAVSLEGLGNVAYEQGDYAAARSRYEESLAIFRKSGDKYGIVKALSNLASVALGQGDYDAAHTVCEECLQMQRELGDRQGIAESLNDLGDVAYRQGDYDTARSLYEESLAIRRELGHKRGIAESLHNLGRAVYYQGDSAAARSLWEESLTLRRELGDRQGVAYSLNNLGVVTYEQRDFAAARSLLEESVAIFQEVGHKAGIALSLNNLGNVVLEQGDYAAAHPLQEESLTIRRELGDKRGIAESLESFASLAAVEVQPSRALCLAGAAAALREAIGAPLSPTEQAWLEHHLEPARQALGEEAAARAFAEGRAMTMEQAIEYAARRII